MNDYSVIGRSIPRPDAWEKVVGGRGYPVNLRLPGMLHGTLLRSPHPHARIAGMDASRALALPGVKALITPADVPRIPYSATFFKPATSAAVVRDMLILDGTVRYAGQPVAAVAATTASIAEHALELIEVQYEELPAVFDPEEAMREGAPEIHAGVRHNVIGRPTYSLGDIEAGFSAADHVFEGVYETQRVHTCYMEPRVCVADADAQGRVTVYASVQHLFGLREKLAFVLGLPVSSVRAVQPPYIGGGFGGKLDLAPIEPLAALLSLRARRPVRIEQSRYEDFITSSRHPAKVYLKTGISRDGQFTARYARTLLDASAYASEAPEVIRVHSRFGLMLGYRCPNAKWEGTLVYTNNMPGGAFRGYGAPQGCFAVESQIDEICEKLGFDPVEFRLKHAPRCGDPHPSNAAWKLDSYGFDECLVRGAERFGWRSRAKAASGRGVKKRGFGMAAQPLWVSGCLGAPDTYEHSGAIVKLNTDGSADLATATIDIGSGQTAVLCQIAAEELGISVEAVRLSGGSTDTLPVDAATHASRTTYASGIAVKAAAAAAKKRLLEVAETMLEASAVDLEVREGMVRVKGASAHAVPVADVVKRAESPFVQITSKGTMQTVLAEKGTIIGTSSLAPPRNPSPASAQFIEVEVDTDTGEVRVLRAVYAHDIGRVVNLAGAEGQVEGGLQQGIGYALMENMRFEPETGACVTADFLNYKMPTAVEMPRSIESIFVETDEPSGPFGAKGLAEPCLIVPAPAIANAIYNAVGVRVRSLPITPEKILAGLGKI
ncbi:MAG: molybdopterin-dependent oxidoreductase [Burkholderiales bacterium]|nr:molybdopterin-dependent oxidoreductase [Burkholderiales bacterium]